MKTQGGDYALTPPPLLPTPMFRSPRPINNEHQTRNPAMSGLFGSKNAIEVKMNYFQIHHISGERCKNIQIYFAL